MKKKLPKSTKKYIRREKARIRREFLDAKKREELIQELYNKFFKKDDNSRNLQSSNK